MEMKRYLVLCFLVVGFGSLVRPASADKLRWKFAVGDEYKVNLEQSTNMSTVVTKIARNKIDVFLKMGAEMDWKVLSLQPNGNAVIEQSYTRMHVQVEKGTKEKLAYDTASEKDPDRNAKHFADVYDKLIGIKFKVEMSDRGEIVAVVLENDDIETIRSIPESMEARKLFEKRGLVEILNGGGFVLPEEDIEAGHEWPVTKTQKLSFGTAIFESVFTYQGKKENSEVASIKLKATAKLTDVPKDPIEKPLELKSQNQTGTIEFDPLNGFVRSIQLEQNMETVKPFREMTIQTNSRVNSIFRLEKTSKSPSDSPK